MSFPRYTQDTSLNEITFPDLLPLQKKSRDHASPDFASICVLVSFFLSRYDIFTNDFQSDLCLPPFRSASFSASLMINMTIFAWAENRSEIHFLEEVR